MAHKLCIIYGGQSSEHKDSVESFDNLYNVIRENRAALDYTLAHIIYVGLDNTAYLHEVDFRQDSTAYRDGVIKADLFDTMVELKQEGCFLFSTLFSQNGEDGRMQGAVKLIGLQSNLGDPLPSSLCLSKYHLNRYLMGTARDFYIPKTLRIASRADFDAALPVFMNDVVVVKPNALGSSILTEKLTLKGNEDAAWAIIEKILVHDSHALLQEYIEGEEYTCGVLEQQGKVSVLAIGKVNTTRKFFGFPEKNDAALNSKEIIPHPYEPVLQQLATGVVQLFLDLNLTNIARFDFIVRNGRIYFLECNQFPSLHRYSFFMLMLKEWKLTIADVVGIIMKNEAHRKVVDPLFRGYDVLRAPEAHV